MDIPVIHAGDSNTQAPKSCTLTPPISAVPSKMSTRETEKFIEHAVLAGAVFDEEEVCTHYRDLARGQIPSWPNACPEFVPATIE